MFLVPRLVGPLNKLISKNYFSSVQICVFTCQMESGKLNLIMLVCLPLLWPLKNMPWAVQLASTQYPRQSFASLQLRSQPKRKDQPPKLYCPSPALLALGCIP